MDNVMLCHILLGIWLLIHVGIQVKPCLFLLKEPQVANLVVSLFLAGLFSRRCYTHCSTVPAFIDLRKKVLSPQIYLFEITVTSQWARLRLKSPASTLFTQPFIRVQIKETSKLRVTGLCVGNSPGPVNSPHKGPVTRKMFPFDDVIIRFSAAIHYKDL